MPIQRKKSKYMCNSTQYVYDMVRIKLNIPKYMCNSTQHVEVNVQFNSIFLRHVPNSTQQVSIIRGAMLMDISSWNSSLYAYGSSTREIYHHRENIR